MKNPKVFICHGSDDKMRFVSEFARKLWDQGIDAWIDEAEILAGENLIEKIFEEGFSGAECVLIVLSKNSIDKPWVKKELNSSVIRQIEEKLKIIPILLDDCEVPAALKDGTKYVRINDLADYGTQLDEIIASVLNNKSKKTLGELPAYSDNLLNHIYGIEPLDEKVLKLACDFAFQNEETITDPLNISKIYKDASGNFIIPKEQLLDSFEVLGKEFYFELSHCIGSGDLGSVSHFRITSYGFQQYAESYLQGFNSSIRSVIAAIVNEGERTNTDIVKKLGMAAAMIGFAAGYKDENQKPVAICLAIGLAIILFGSLHLWRAMFGQKMCAEGQQPEQLLIKKYAEQNDLKNLYISGCFTIQEKINDAEAIKKVLSGHLRLALLSLGLTPIAMGIAYYVYS